MTVLSNLIILLLLFFLTEESTLGQSSSSKANKVKAELSKGVDGSVMSTGLR